MILKNKFQIWGWCYGTNKNRKFTIEFTNYLNQKHQSIKFQLQLPNEENRLQILDTSITVSEEGDENFNKAKEYNTAKLRNAGRSNYDIERSSNITRRNNTRTWTINYINKNQFKLTFPLLMTLFIINHEVN